MEGYIKIFSHIGSVLSAIEEVQPPPLHSKLGEQWWDSAANEWSMVCSETGASQDFKKKGESTIECFQMAYDILQTTLLQQEAVKANATQERIEHLLSKPQSVQRTDEWYKEMRNVLSASELYKLFGTPRARSDLVLSKVEADEKQQQAPPRSSCLTMEMNSLDWGIRFEPVAKQILEDMWKAKIAEMGRLHHPTKKGLAASPDGLIIECNTDPALLGNLVEIKCPSTREVGKGVPPNYWYQMQLQMEVSDSPVCQYCEFTIKSFTAKQQEINMDEGESRKGNIFILQNMTEPQMNYEYSPLDDMNWRPTPQEGWEIVEVVPWYLEKLWIHPVLRDQAWFESVVPLIDHFWKDVEGAKNGTFQQPEPMNKRRTASCGIID